MLTRCIYSAAVCLAAAALLSAQTSSSVRTVQAEGPRPAGLPITTADLPTATAVPYTPSGPEAQPAAPPIATSGPPMQAMGPPPLLEGSCCADGACGGKDCHFWISGDYLIWWLKGSPLPVLITSGAASDAPRIGIPGEPGTQVLFGGKDVNGDHIYSGAQTRMGWTYDWLAGDFGGFVLEQNATNFSVTSDPAGRRIYGFPFFALPANQPFFGAVSLNTTGAPLLAGSASAGLTTQLWGADGTLGWNRPDSIIRYVFAGLRYLELHEKLEIGGFSNVLADNVASFENMAVAPGSSILFRDSFHTDNQFIGGQIGCVGAFQTGQLEIDVRAAISAGINHANVDVTGSSTLFGSGPQAALGGLFALPSNIGSHSRDALAIVPEMNVTAGWRLTSWARVSVGYSLLYWTAVLRPGKQVDQALNTAQIPTSPAFDATNHLGPPFVSLNSTSPFWAQGACLGLTLSF